MEVGRRRWLVEAEVDEGDMTFLPVLNNGPVDERDDALHDRIRQSFEELMEEDERDEEVVTALERGLSPEMSREEGKVSLKREAKTHDLGS
jgi:predicted nuclease of restriction endonuclease-like RecB superfamily